MLAQLEDYQKKGVRLIAKHNGVILLADDMQIGKTIQVLKWCFNHPEIRPVLIVCKEISKYVFEEQAKNHFNMRTVLLEGQKPKELKSKNSIYIINYDIFKYWLPHFKELKIQALILDESQKIKSRSAKRTKAIQKLVFNYKDKFAPSIPHRIAMSGTPLVNRPAELWTTLNLLWPTEFPHFFPFAMRYCKPVRTPWGWIYKGAAHLDELHNRLKKLGMIRRLAKGTLVNYQEPNRTIIPVDIDKEEYDKVENDFIQWLQKKSIVKAKRAAKAEKLVRMHYLKRLAAAAKIGWVYEWIEDALENHYKKIVVYAWHKDIIQKIHKRYKNISVVVDGSVKGKKKKIAENYFKRNKNIRIFIGQIEAAGESISLSTASHKLAFAELPWTPGQVNQVEKRINGYGQTKQVEIDYLIAKDTIEEDLCKLLQKKQEVLSATLDGSSQINKLDIYNELEKILLKKKGRTLK